MNKLAAHTIVGLLDIGALAACLHVFNKWQQINQQIRNGAESIEVQGYIGLYLLMAVVPVTHLLTIVSWQDRLKIWVNRLLVLAFLIALTCAVFINFQFKNQLLKFGYRYCDSQSQQMSFSVFETYLRGDMRCSE